ncbi:hypothetical protein K469DRAFT_687657 [Zopfia rhizophila CBS 207.26]|uniref:Uncharacterized protein n=1 Tax=Zopfia rhizophila CBS 207.26 TaxID=1314779 RepID=A0A6A6E5M6_9PEZI|nr:hypothetical protein K469DRAFT_687657 [Zopfia rhizophila CBS 207.26]
MFQEIKWAHYSLAKKHHLDKQGPGTCPDAHEFRKSAQDTTYITCSYEKNKSNIAYEREKKAAEKKKTRKRTKKKQLARDKKEREKLKKLKETLAKERLQEAAQRARE